MVQFWVDILAVSHASWSLLYTIRGNVSGTIKGSDKVSSLIITPPGRPDSLESLWSFKRLLDNFSNVENLDVAQHHSGGEGPLRLCELEQAVYGEKVKEYRTPFDVLIEQINWF
jgi:hypothetical protein